MSTKIDQLLAAAQTQSSGGHHRHHPTPTHHQGALALGVVVSLLLVALVFIATPHRNSAPKYTPPTTSVAAEVALTRQGIAQDFTDINAADLSDNLLSR